MRGIQRGAGAGHLFDRQAADFDAGADVGQDDVHRALRILGVARVLEGEHEAAVVHLRDDGVLRVQARGECAHEFVDEGVAGDGFHGAQFHQVHADHGERFARADQSAQRAAEARAVGQLRHGVVALQVRGAAFGHARQCACAIAPHEQ
jgi:hypothetical protein